MITSLFVFYGPDRVGRLWLDPQRRWIFQYDSTWTKLAESFPISVRMGVQDAAFEDDTPKSFFANLLPEGNVRQRIAAKLGISLTNDFALLAAIGGDCAGALSLQIENTAPVKKGNYRKISEVELDSLIRDMSRRPLLTADGRARLSLAGAQEKLPIYFKSKVAYIPEEGAVSSHILKPSISDLRDTAHNEVFCMQLAKQMGLNVPSVELWQLNFGPVFLTERYDRCHHADGTVSRLHQEDFCQALGKMPDQKYQNEGGPSFTDCERMLRYGVQPVLDKQQIIAWTIFNFLIGNCDAHAKNISLMISEKGIRLAPFYDIMSTIIYDGLSDKMAMKIGGHYERNIIVARHWEKFANDIDVKSTIVLQILREFSKKLPELAQREGQKFIAQHGGAETISKIISVTETAAKRFI